MVVIWITLFPRWMRKRIRFGGTLSLMLRFTMLKKGLLICLVGRMIPLLVLRGWRGSCSVGLRKMFRVLRGLIGLWFGLVPLLISLLGRWLECLVVTRIVRLKSVLWRSRVARR